MSSPKRQKSLDADELRGARLAAARGLTGLSQQEMADKLKVSRQTVSGWENGAEIEETRMDEVARAYRASRGWIRYAEGRPPEGLATMEPMRLTHPDEDVTVARRTRR